MYEVIQGGVTAAKGFMAAFTAAGIKYKNRPDMAMIYSQVPCESAGTFTTNLVKAAPVKWDKAQVTSGAASSDRKCRNRQCLYGKRGNGLLRSDCQGCSRSIKY